MFWPSTLVHDYGAARAAAWSSLPGALAIFSAIVTALALWRRDRWRWLAFLALSFFVVLAPSSSVVPIASEVAAERRLYLGLAFVVIAVVVALEALRQRLPVAKGNRAVALAAALAFIALGATSFHRSSEYNNPEGLWRESVAFNPRNGRAVENLAMAVIRADSSRVEEADSLWRRATEIDSMSPSAWVGRAAVAIHQDRLFTAESSLVKALVVSPGDSAAVDKLAAVYVATGRPEPAVPLRKQIAAKFANAKADEDLGIAYLNAGELDSAAATLATAVRLDSTRTTAMAFLGAALVESQRGPEAIAYLVRAAALDSQPAFALSLLSIAYAQVGRRNASVDAANQAVLRAARDAFVLTLAGRGLLGSGEASKAKSVFEQALAISPGDPEIITRLSMAEWSLGNAAEARALLRRVLQIAPGYGLALTFLTRPDSVLRRP